MRTSRKAIAGVFAAVVGTLALASAAYAAPTPPDASTEAIAVFNASWPEILDVVKSMAPYIVAAGLTLLVIRKVVGSAKRGKAPSF